MIEANAIPRWRHFFPGVLALLPMFVAAAFFAAPAKAATAEEIDAGVDAALERFRDEVKGGAEFLDAAKGVLVFPRVIKAGFVVGGEYGEGALRVDGETVDYYSTAGGSFGFQFGAQARSVLVVFMQQGALDDFRVADNNWEAGVDGSVVLIDVGAGRDLSTMNIRDPIVGFIFGARGLMANLSLQGTRIRRIER